MNKYCMNCWGTGKIPDFWDNDKEVICPHCNGTGIEPPMTNDEWRRTCSAEEFAKFVDKAMDYGAFCQAKDDFNPKTCKKCGCPWCKNGFMEWLKEIHV